jgi:hypothetical protein
MVNVPWPVSLKPSDFGYSCRNYDISGGISVAGGEQFIASPGARWTASMELPIRSNADVLTIRALRSQLQGRANPTLLPNFDGLRVSWPVEAGTGRILTPKVAHQLAGTYGLEGTPYGGPAIPSAAQINATVQTAALLHATQIIINMTQGGPILAGQQFGIANRLYEIATVDLVAGANTTVTFKPPLRAAASVGAAVTFTRPVCLMRCVNLDEQTGKFAALRYATLSLEFVEYI